MDPNKYNQFIFDKEEKKHNVAKNGFSNNGARTPELSLDTDLISFTENNSNVSQISKYENPTR